MFSKQGFNKEVTRNYERTAKGQHVITKFQPFKLLVCYASKKICIQHLLSLQEIISDRQAKSCLSALSSGFERTNLSLPGCRTGFRPGLSGLVHYCDVFKLLWIQILHKKMSMNEENRKVNWRQAGSASCHFHLLLFRIILNTYFFIFIRSEQISLCDIAGRRLPENKFVAGGQIRNWCAS